LKESGASGTRLNVEELTYGVWIAFRHCRRRYDATVTKSSVHAILGINQRDARPLIRLV
jgi:hypothetical protein